jgi:hypothetical protein
MHSTGAAQRHAAAELRAGHAQHVAQHPEERRVVVDIDAVCVPVHFNGEGHRASPFYNGDRQRNPPTPTRSCELSTSNIHGAQRVRTKPYPFASASGRGSKFHAAPRRWVCRRDLDALFCDQTYTYQSLWTVV